jgi:hypothetical protein
LRWTSTAVSLDDTGTKCSLQYCHPDCACFSSYCHACGW